MPRRGQPPRRSESLWKAVAGRSRRLLYPVILLLVLAVLFTQPLEWRRALALTKDANPRLLLLAVAAEVLRFGGMGVLLYVLAAAIGVRTQLLSAVRLSLVAVAARYVLPLAGVPDYVLRARFLRRHGACGEVVAAYLVLDSVLGWLALMAIYLAGFIGYLLTHRGLPPRPAIFGVAAVGTVLALAVAIKLRRDPQRIEAAVIWAHGMLQRTLGRLLRRPLGDAERIRSVLAAAGRAGAPGPDTAGRTPGRVARIAAATLLPPLADLVALALVFAAVGQPVDPTALLLGYGLAGYLAFLTPLPADGGVVEAALTLVFATLGYDLYAVVVGVVVFRLLSFWLPIPIGLLAGLGYDREAWADTGNWIAPAGDRGRDT